MRSETLWETVCRMTAESSEGTFDAAAAIERAAGGQAVGEVQMRQFESQGLIEPAGEGSYRLTEAGLSQCAEPHRTSQVVGDDTAFGRE